jgi:hypothetical protein
MRYGVMVTLHDAIGYDVMITLYDAMGYDAIVLHGAENYNKVTASCDHGALTCGSMQCNYGALRLGAVRKCQIVKFLQIQFILC